LFFVYNFDIDVRVDIARRKRKVQSLFLEIAFPESDTVGYFKVECVFLVATSIALHR